MCRLNVFMITNYRMKGAALKLTKLLVVLMLGTTSLLALAERKVLYVTHEPGTWHAYTEQLASFKQLADSANWQLVVATGDLQALGNFLRQPDYGMGYDAIVYNFCLADARDLEAMTNLMAQTLEHGVPALLLHCAMHSWWDTFKRGSEIPGHDNHGARASESLVERWKSSNPDQPFPLWGDFTGIASTSHGPQSEIALEKVAEHPALRNVPDGYETPETELYNNEYTLPGVKPLLKGKQRAFFGAWRAEAVVMWEVQRGAGTLLALTWGHGDEDWSDPVFRQLLIDSVDYLAEKSSE